MLVKIDFSNAFNSLHRRDMVLSVHNRVPELCAYCWSAYNQPPFLFFGPTVLSHGGAQQGDSIGPLLFCNTIHPTCMLLSLQVYTNHPYHLGSRTHSFKLSSQHDEHNFIDRMLFKNANPVSTQ